MTDSEFSIALPGTSVWQRALAKRVEREVELLFHLLDGSDRQGWVTGLDEEWLQLTDRDLRMHLIRVEMIVGVEETGAKFYQLGFTEEQKKDFKAYSARFRDTCARTLKSAGDSAHYRRPERAVS